MAEKELFNEFGRLPVAALYEGGGRTGALPANLRPIGKTCDLAGPAFTVKCIGGSNVPIHRAVYLAKPGEVLVIAVHGENHRALLGDLLGLAASLRGIAGIVIDGFIRDLAELETLGLPIFCRGSAVDGPLKGEAADAGLQKPVTIGTATIKPGDCIRGDADGVVSVARGQLRQAVANARTRLKNEAKIRDRMSTSGERLRNILGIDL